MLFADNLLTMPAQQRLLAFSVMSGVEGCMSLPRSLRMCLYMGGQGAKASNEVGRSNEVGFCMHTSLRAALWPRC